MEIIEAECCPDHIHMTSNDTTIFKRIEFYGIFKKQK